MLFMILDSPGGGAGGSGRNCKSYFFFVCFNLFITPKSQPNYVFWNTSEKKNVSGEE